MSIYRIHPDRLNFSLLRTISTKEILDKLGREYPFHIDPTPKSYEAVWSALEVGFYDSSDKGTASELPDITVGNGKLFLNARAYEQLHSLLEPHGEFLPVTYGKNEGYIFNCLSLAEDVAGLDEKLSIKNEYGDLQSLVFHEDKVHSMAIFRSEFDGYMGFFCKDDFKDAVESAGLKGITFSIDLGNIFPPDPSAQSPSLH